MVDASSDPPLKTSTKLAEFTDRALATPPEDTVTAPPFNVAESSTRLNRPQRLPRS